jgi:hypothetical protein
VRTIDDGPRVEPRRIGFATRRSRRELDVGLFCYGVLEAHHAARETERASRPA